MTKGTRSKEMYETLKKQKVLLVEERTQCQVGERHLQRHETMQAAMVEMINSQTALQQQIQSISEQMQTSNSHCGYRKNRVGESDRSYQNNSTSFPKVEFSYFDSVDARGWVRKCNWYFQVISTFPDDQKVPLASVHFQGKVEMWFQNFIEGRPLPTWKELGVAVMEMFDDVIPGLLPKKFQHAVSLAKTFEKSVDALISLVGGASKVDSPTPVRRLLTAEEMKTRREKNLCYNCDKIYTPGHRCKQRHVYMMMTAAEKDAYTGEFVSSEVAGKEVVIKEGKVSLNAMLGSMGESSIRVERVVARKRVQILIDNGSTHSFVDERIVEKLDFERNYDSPLIVSMADGYTLTSRVTFPDFSWSMHKLIFTQPIKLMNLGGV
ncbi:hypothetical protein CDL12_10004 [Handroanthus impetiginosus]|uniref:Retrotransposon gag domain-containing protein n=1 Tax=Handroanthus impetiginosus TaxID=429701 RepID=A0A2G9HII5_9LAMI|nr:hypothetical protein CDL12_10004 [Handroanthus impetiginosus]